MIGGGVNFRRHGGYSGGMRNNAKNESAPLMLSVSGARGIVGRSMTPDVGWRLAAAFGNELQLATGKRDPLVVVGRDSRPSSEMLGAAAVAGLLATGCRTMRLGCVMTPTAAVMIGEHRADGGLVVTASHNPIEWNGLKCLNMEGVAPPVEQAERIIARFKANEIELTCGDGIEPMLHELGGTEVHVNRVLTALGEARVEAIQKRGFKVVLDSVNGAGCIGGRMLLEEGLGCELVHLNGEPTGFFSHTPEPTKENLTELAVVTAREGADVGFAQDPDADRLAIVDARGVYIGEEYTLVLAAESVLGAMRAEEREGGSIVTNLSTSRMMDDVAERFGMTLSRTAVGESNVVEGMKKAGDGNAAAVIGGEGNGGVIWPAVVYVRDSLSGMALVLSLLSERGKLLRELIADWPGYSFLKAKVGIRAGLAHEVIEAIAAKYDGAGESGCVIDRTDGIRLDFAERGCWLHVRASNTEPILRILAEGRTAADANGLVDTVRGLVEGG